MQWFIKGKNLDKSLFLAHWGFIEADTLSIITRLGRIKNIIMNMPPIINIRKKEFNKNFELATNANLFKGIYANHQEAINHSPKTKIIGYDNKAPAEMYKERVGKINPYDYPVLFWFEKILDDENNNIFDFGGHIGLSFYSFIQYLSVKELNWVVYDLDEVVNAGIEFAKDHDVTRQLSFTRNLSDASKINIFFASGSLQYLEGNLSEILSGLSDLPGYIIVNMLPAYQGIGFYTLQNIGTAFCPYQIFNNDDFINSILDMNYKLLDEWKNEDKSCEVAFEPEHSLDYYKGYIFKKIY